MKDSGRSSGDQLLPSSLWDAFAVNNAEQRAPLVESMGKLGLKGVPQTTMYPAFFPPYTPSPHLLFLLFSILYALIS